MLTIGCDVKDTSYAIWLSDVTYSSFELGITLAIIGKSNL